MLKKSCKTKKTLQCCILTGPLKEDGTVEQESDGFVWWHTRGRSQTARNQLLGGSWTPTNSISVKRESIGLENVCWTKLDATQEASKFLMITKGHGSATVATGHGLGLIL